MEKKRNLYIDALRFLFACIVFLYHFRSYDGSGHQFGDFSGGYLGVEFFFLVAGYYLIGRVNFHDTQAVRFGFMYKKIKDYAVSRYKKLYPEYLISILMMIVVSFIVTEEYRSIGEIVGIIPDVLCVQIFFYNIHVNSLLWFVSSLIWSSVFINIVLCNKKKYLAYILLVSISFVVIIMGAAFIGHLNVNQNKWFYLDGLVRGCVDILLGSTINIVVKSIRKSDIKLNIKALKAFFYVDLIAICTYMFFGGETRVDFLILILIYFLIMSAELIYSEMKINSIQYRVIGFAGIISYSLYLNQVLIQKVIHGIFPNRNYWLMAIIALIFDLIISTIVYISVSLLRKFISNYFRRASNEHN